MQIPWEALAALGMWVTGSTFYFIWWMATITEKMNNLITKVKELSTSGFASKEYVDREFGKVQKDIDETRRRVDEIQMHRGDK